jgi:hypothetical protein
VWTKGGYRWQSAPILADLNDDGRQDVVQFNWSLTDASVDAYSGTDGALLWSHWVRSGGGYTGHDRLRPSGCIMVLGGNPPMAFAGYSYENLTALNAIDGEVLWTVPGTTVNAEPVCIDVNGDGSEDIISAVGPQWAQAQRIAAFNGTDGQLIWALENGADVWTEALSAADINGDGLADIVFTNQSGTWAVQAVNGTALWNVPQSERYLTGIPILVPDVLSGARLVVMSGDGGAVALDGRDGSLVWNRSLSAAGHRVGVARRSVNGPIEVFSYDTVLDAVNGSVLWKLPLPVPEGFYAFVDADLDGILDVAFQYQYSYALVSGSSHQVVWTFGVSSPPRPIAVGDLTGDGYAELVYAGDIGVLGVLGKAQPPPPPKALVASLRAGPYFQGGALEIWANTSVSGGVAPYSLELSFGDGSQNSSLTTWNPWHYETHKFSGPGSYIIIVRVRDSSGQSAAATLSIDVKAFRVRLSVSPDSGVAPLQVQIDVQPDGGDPPHAYNVSFGDGTWTSASSGPHVYMKPGQYLLTAHVVDASQVSVWENATVSVDLPPSEPPSATGPPMPPAGMAIIASAALGSLVGTAVAMKVTRSSSRNENRGRKG